MMGNVIVPKHTFETRQMPTRKPHRIRRPTRPYSCQLRHVLLLCRTYGASSRPDGSALALLVTKKSPKYITHMHTSTSIDSKRNQGAATARLVGDPPMCAAAMKVLEHHWSTAPHPPSWNQGEISHASKEEETSHAGQDGKQTSRHKNNHGARRDALSRHLAAKMTGTKKKTSREPD